MRMLLWKEFRQSSRLLIVCGVLLVMPYVVAGASGLYDHTRPDPSHLTKWSEYILGASFAAVFVCALLSAFIGGNAIAGERSDRSAEFLAYLPIPRGTATACKAGFAIAILLAIFFVNVAIARTAAAASDVSPVSSPMGIFPALFATGVFLFGTSWLGSTIFRTPGNAAVTALGVLAVLWMPILFIEEQRGWSADTSEAMYIATSVVLGLACFVGGTVYYLGRTSP